MVEIPEQAVQAALDVIHPNGWELSQRICLEKALTAAAPYISGVKVNNDVVERVARAWASIDGKSSEFDRAKKDREFDRTDGSYSGYMAEAKELIKRSGLFDTEPFSAREQALEEAAKLIEEGFEKQVGKAWRNDGKPSKNDECPHGKFMYEDCERCASDAIRALSAQPAATEAVAAEGEITEIEANNKRLRKDAERYRHIREGNQWVVASTQTGFHVSGEHLDELVDAALAQGGGE